MFKPVSVAIGLRYLRAKRRNGFISFISMASIIGIALGVMVLITTMAVMSGFQKEIRDRLLQMTAHATVTAEGEPMRDWQQAVDVASKDARIIGAAPYIEIQGMLSGPRVQGAVVQGVDPALEAKVSVIAEKMTEGSLDTLEQGKFNIILGKELALWLGVGVGDNVVATLAEVQGTPWGQWRGPNASMSVAFSRPATTRSTVAPPSSTCMTWNGCCAATGSPGYG